MEEESVAARAESLRLQQGDEKELGDHDGRRSYG